ncbi:hypothetical protein FOMPIDRAFT_89053 [Fomitopsis schrenkii]|uniref:Uncharacterized protein n=1 Tax=Fomitopsis schrenkii TaxID=2126942 RepID=S8EG82_FOMSC|nr:hypothetical protein FOMPIDRAFT_89053 [Fomitopsis schrenkii]
MAYYQNDYSSTRNPWEQFLDVDTPLFTNLQQPAAASQSSAIDSYDATPIAGDATSPTRAPGELSYEFLWLDPSTAAEEEPFPAYSWEMSMLDSEGLSMRSETATASLKRKRSALDDNLGGGVATEEEAFRPSKVARSGGATTTDAAPTVGLDSEGPTDAEPLALGRDTLHGHDIGALLDFDSVPDFEAPDFIAPPFSPALQFNPIPGLSVPGFIPAPKFVADTELFPSSGCCPLLDPLDMPVFPEPPSPSEAASPQRRGEPSVHKELTAEEENVENLNIEAPDNDAADERDEESLDTPSSSSNSSATTPDPEPEAAQPAPRPLQWVVRNPGNQMGLEEDRRIGETDFWCADAPVEHRHYRRSQPCDVPGCDVRFAPGSAASFTFHDGRTQAAGHKRLRYRCPRPGCNRTYGRADSMKVHLKKKQVCGDFALGVLQPIYGEEAVPAIDRLAEWQVLPHFATMKS